MSVLSVDFSYIFRTAQRWGYSVYDAFIRFGEWATQPLVPRDSQLYDFLETLSWAFSPALSSLIDKYVPGSADTIWDLSLLDLLIPGCFVIALYSLIKWVVGLL